VRSRPLQGAKRAAAPDENTGQTQQEMAATGRRKKRPLDRRGNSCFAAGESFRHWMDLCA
jgi:hypothetical protein